MRTVAYIELLTEVCELHTCVLDAQWASMIRPPPNKVHVEADKKEQEGLLLPFCELRLRAYPVINSNFISHSHPHTREAQAAPPLRERCISHPRSRRFPKEPYSNMT